MKDLVYVLLLGLVLTPLARAEDKEKLPLTVTYVGNEGFLIECEGKKVLIDALFGGWESAWCQVPPDSVVELMTAARPPFDSVDLIAVTHAHLDHFDADIVAAHTKHNRRGILVCTPHAAQKLEASEYYLEIESRIRVVSARGDSTAAIELSGIELLVFPTRHGPYWEKDENTGETIDRHRNVQHLEFLFTIGGWNLFHCRDASLDDFEGYRSYDIDRGNIDVAFLHWWGVWNDNDSSQRTVREVIQPEWIFLMHLMPERAPPGQPEKQKPIASEIIVPRQPLQKWTVL
ncbi:MAG: MBL fold metallo-hydrolase [Deltaproteobacteria bacterium]|nr:MAG: MBL fold metallo-hydrolase [Deltaproteobacteria bacterium]